MELPLRSPLIQTPAACIPALEEYRERNASHERCLAFHVTDRGLFAELSDVTRAAIYAWQNDLQLVLEASRFRYRLERGIEDYFEPFCRPIESVAADRIVERFEFLPREADRRPVRRLQVYRTANLRIGDVDLRGFAKIYDFFQRMLFQLTPEMREKVRDVLRPLPVSDPYYAIHIRRGDKIGDEDVHYPAGAYLDALGTLPPDSTIFVMSDEFSAVEEIERNLRTRGLRNPLVTLAREDDSGFDVEMLRRGESFLSHRDGRADAVGREYVADHTVRLLTEMAVATGATRTVSTRKSFVGLTLRSLDDTAARVELLESQHSQTYTAPKLPPDRHILDVYDKVFLITIGHRGAGFFAYVQYALNQIQYCERRRYLPVVHFDGAFGNHFHDPSVGDDMWDYYFEPVAGYSKADIDRMLADPNDRLTTEEVIRLSSREIMDLCQFDPRSIFHYTYGYWRENLPGAPDEWYAAMRRKGHRYVAEYIRIKDPILAEVDRFVAEHMRGRSVLGAHIRGTDMRYAPPVPLERFQGEIETLLREQFDCVFVATDQQQYIDILRARFGDRMISRDCLRSTDARNPMWLKRPSPSEQGKEVLTDALLLSRCRFMLKSPSAVSEFAHYFRPTLKSRDLNEHRVEFEGQDYTKPGLGYGDYPNAWDVVGHEPAEKSNASQRAAWTPPAIRRRSS